MCMYPFNQHCHFYNRREKHSDQKRPYWGQKHCYRIIHTRSNLQLPRTLGWIQLMPKPRIWDLTSSNFPLFSKTLRSIIIVGGHLASTIPFFHLFEHRCMLSKSLCSLLISSDGNSSSSIVNNCIQAHMIHVLTLLNASLSQSYPKFEDLLYALRREEEEEYSHGWLGSFTASAFHDSETAPICSTSHIALPTDSSQQHNCVYPATLMLYSWVASNIIYPCHNSWQKAPYHTSPAFHIIFATLISQHHIKQAFDRPIQCVTHVCLH